jgi:hypothetical protein
MKTPYSNVGIMDGESTIVDTMKMRVWNVATLLNHLQQTVITVKNVNMEHLVNLKTTKNVKFIRNVELDMDI